MSLTSPPLVQDKVRQASGPRAADGERHFIHTEWEPGDHPGGGDPDTGDG